MLGFFSVVEKFYRVIMFPHSLALDIIHISTWAFILVEISSLYVKFALRESFTSHFLMLDSGTFMQVDGKKKGVSVWATESQTQEKMDHSCTVHRSTSFLPLPASHKSHSAPSASKGVREKATLCKERQCIFQDKEKQQERLVGKTVTHLT